MDIHKKFNSQQEYTEFFLELISWKANNKSLWRENDLPLLESFFKYSNNPNRRDVEMTEEEKTSFDHWVKCNEDYGDRNKDIKNSINGIDEYRLAEAFGFEVIEDEDEEKPLEYSFEKFKQEEEIEFPLFVTGYIDSDHDRSGPISVCMIRFVTLKDFQ